VALDAVVEALLLLLLNHKATPSCDLVVCLGSLLSTNQQTGQTRVMGAARHGSYAAIYNSQSVIW